MKTLSLSIGGVLFVVNLAILILLTSCANIVTIMSTFAIVSTALLIFASCKLPIKDGFKVSLPFLFVFNGIVEYILSFFINPDQIKNDGFFIAIILIFIFQLICLIIVNTVSRNA